VGLINGCCKMIAAVKNGSLDFDSTQTARWTSTRRNLRWRGYLKAKTARS